MYPIVHSPVKIREKRATASLQIAYSYLVSGPVMLISIMHEPSVHHSLVMQPDMINFVFLRHIQSCSHELSHHASLCHVKRYLVMYALQRTYCTDSLCHDFFPAKLHFVIHNHTSLLSSCTIMQCFIRSCTILQWILSCTIRPWFLQPYTFRQCFILSCTIPQSSILSCTIPQSSFSVMHHLFHAQPCRAAS